MSDLASCFLVSANPFFAVITSAPLPGLLKPCVSLGAYLSSPFFHHNFDVCVTSCFVLPLFSFVHER